MTRKTFREKLGIFVITLGVLGGLYGLFSALARAANGEECARHQPNHKSTSVTQRDVEILRHANETLEDMAEAAKLTIAQQKRELDVAKEEVARLQGEKARHAIETQSLSTLVGVISGETGLDGLDAFMDHIRVKLRQDRRLFVPGGVLQDGFTLADLLRAIEQGPRMRRYSL